MNTKLLWGLVLALGAVGGVLVARIPRTPPLPPGFAALRGLSGARSNDVLAVKMERCAEQAMLDAWSRYGILLRAEAKSLPDLESYLDRVSRDPRFRAASEQDRLAEALVAGGLIGEAIRHDHGGTWVDSDSSLPAAGSYALRMDGHTVWPVTWAQKRLFNGPGDNVHHKYLATVTGQTNGLVMSVTLWTNGPGGLEPPPAPATP